MLKNVNINFTLESVGAESTVRLRDMQRLGPQAFGFHIMIPD